jgi:hypothetical protein
MSSMRIEDYRTYLQGQGIPRGTIEQELTVVRDFVLDVEQATTGSEKEKVERFAQRLIAEGRNTLDNLSALRDYTNWLGHRQLYVALIEVMDCHNALAVLAEEIEERHGRGARDRVFREALPPLGASEEERCAYTRTITEQMAQQMTAEEIRVAWFQVQHGIPAEAWFESDLADEEKYRQCGDIDEFLSLKRRERDSLLTRLRDEHRLWYTTEINDQVLEFIKRDPEMEVGRREGNRIYITKVPYNAVRYLDETDPRKKRYYACHCPMLREAIRRDWWISPDVCYCSLGHASHYLAGLGLDIKGQVLESAVRGDTRCRFVFFLPNMVQLD